MDGSHGGSVGLSSLSSSSSPPSPSSSPPTPPRSRRDHMGPSSSVASFGVHNNNSNNATLKQWFVQVSSNALAVVLLLATVVSNARAVTVAIVSNCVHRRGGRSKQMAKSKGPRKGGVPISTVFYVSLALLFLLTVPFAFWLGRRPFDDVRSYFTQLVIGWASALHISVWPVAFVAVIASLILAYRHDCYEESVGKVRPCSIRFILIVFATSLALFVFNFLSIQLQIIVPSWAWNPFMWGKFSVYRPNNIHKRLEGICLDYDPHSPMETRDPLCLPRRSWRELGGEVLDPKNKKDVETVMRGIKYAKDESGGLIINVMSRDTVDSIPALRQNVEGLVPFFKDKLSVVIFENDSTDGSREAFKAWAKEATGYKVDLMTCGEKHPDCKFGISHRYDATESKDYFTSSAIGKMADFRQGMVDYIVSSPQYESYSHMIVLDMDLQISFSPLGIMHTFGSNVNDSAVASSGRQVWPGSMGTLIPPYDFSAFRVIETPVNDRLLWLHSKFCALMPEGDRWRNQCDAASPMQLMLMLDHDMEKENPYQVVSAFNGATMYPLKLIKETNAKYDAGNDGQRCEHIGFNEALGKPMYVNPKWNFHVAPERPGGPTGMRALRNVFRIMFLPSISFFIGIQVTFCWMTCVWSFMVLGIYVVYPLLSLFGFGRRRNGKGESLPLTDIPMLQTFAPKQATKHV